MGGKMGELGRQMKDGDILPPGANTQRVRRVCDEVEGIVVW
jgi:hypothetical protein